jgi:hypothetical protein
MKHVLRLAYHRRVRPMVPPAARRPPGGRGREPEDLGRMPGPEDEPTPLERLAIEERLALLRAEQRALLLACRTGRYRALAPIPDALRPR